VIRIDLEDGRSGIDRVAVAQLAGHARRYADEVALFCFTERVGNPAMVADLVAALHADGVSVVDAALVRDGRAHSLPFSHGDPADSLEVGIPLPGDDDAQVQAMAAATVLSGRGILRDRQCLRESIAGPKGRAALQASAALHAAADGLLGTAGKAGPVNHERLRRMAVITVRRALEQASTSGGVEQPTSALLTLLLCDAGVRDQIVSDAVSDLDSPWLPMLIGVARSVPDEDAAHVCAILSVAAYRRGDGALAQVAVDRCLAAEPKHRLADLMLGIMASGMPPGDLGRLAAGDFNPGTAG
jgi:hypothetical protein